MTFIKDKIGTFCLWLLTKRVWNGWMLDIIWAGAGL